VLFPVEYSICPTTILPEKKEAKEFTKQVDKQVDKEAL